MDFDARVIPLHRHPLGFIEAFERLGARQNDLLRGTGVTPALFDMQDVCISYNQLHALIGNGIRQCDRPGLGLEVGMQFDWTYWGPVGFVVYCSTNLKDAAEAFRRYMVTAQPFYTQAAAQPNSYLDANNRVFEPLDYATACENDPVMRRFILDFRLAISLRIWDLCGNKSASDPSVHVQLADPQPEYLAPYQALPCDSITFNCETSTISGHLELVFKRFRRLRQRAFDQIVRQCETELSSLSRTVTFADRVRWHIRAHFRPDLQLGQVAGQMNVTPRSLSRRLNAEQTSFRKLLHEVRMEIASHQLRCSRLSVEDVSELTGFSCASSLRRAVKNWSGATISEMRDVIG